MGDSQSEKQYQAAVVKVCVGGGGTDEGEGGGFREG